MDIEKMIDEIIKNHKHNGRDCSKISGSNVDINVSNYKNIKSPRLDLCLEELDNSIENVNLRLNSGKKLNVVVYNENGNISDSDISINDLENKNHFHNSYLTKIPTGKNGNIIIIKNGDANDSGINIDDIEKIKKVLEKINKVKAEKDCLLIADEDGNVVSSDVKINNLSLKKHKHDNKIDKVPANDGNIPVLNISGNIGDSSVNINDVVLKEELKKKINGLKGDVLVIDDDGNVSNSKKNINNLSLRNHKHSINDMVDLNIKNILINSVEFKSIVEEEVKKVVSKMFKSIKI